MTTLKDDSLSFQAKETKNITDLDKFTIDMPTQSREGKDRNGMAYTYKVVIVDGTDYRVPQTVLSQIKNSLRVKPTTKTFKASKTGTGLKTKYTVVALD